MTVFRTFPNEEIFPTPHIHPHTYRNTYIIRIRPHKPTHALNIPHPHVPFMFCWKLGAKLKFATNSFDRTDIELTYKAWIKSEPKLCCFYRTPISTRATHMDENDQSECSVVRILDVQNPAFSLSVFLLTFCFIHWEKCFLITEVHVSIMDTHVGR